MTNDELKAELVDVVAILTALSTVLPSRVDPGLLSFLNRASHGGVECELLLTALSQNSSSKSARPQLKFG